MKVTLELDLTDIPLAEAGLTLALRRPIKFDVPVEYLKPKNCKEYVLAYLRTGPKRKREIKDYIMSKGYEETGGGPTCSQLVQEKKIINYKRGWFRLP